MSEAISGSNAAAARPSPHVAARRRAAHAGYKEDKMNRSLPIVAALTALVTTVVVPAVAETMDELYAKAKAEGALTLYAAGPTEPHERSAKAFEQRFPGLKVSITGGFSNVLNTRINRQLADKKVEADLVIFQTIQDFVGWKKQGALLSFKPDGFEQVYPHYRDPDGAYVAVHVNTLTYAYNTRLVRPEDAPRSALDFLKPMFRGKLISVYPHDDDAALYLFDTIVAKYGWTYMDRYMENKPSFVQGHLPVARSVATGENAATLDASSSTWRFKREGQPIEVIFSAEDDTPVFTVTAGIFKDAPHPNTAKLYLTWYLAKEQQSRGVVFSPRSDVPPPEGLKPLASYRLADRYREFMIDSERVAELRKRFEAYTGPVVQRGGGVR
jgi:ABC-type Fe3+ transport system substrate-binding protein